MTQLLDTALDLTVAPGYTRIGPALRRRWWPADPEPGCLEGRRVLVTGATSGLGEAAALDLLRLGATVHLLGRNADKVARVAGEVRALAGADYDRVVEEVCDVGDLDAVRAWAGGFAARVPALHGLVHNAGTMTQQRETSAQGHELTYAVHVLGPHLMTHLLGDVLTAGRAVVVWVSSGGMYGASLHDEDPEYTRGDYHGVQAYARTKRMQVVLAREWARRLESSGVAVESMHPGWAETAGVAEHLPTFRTLTRPLLRTAAQGADTAVWLVATRPDTVTGTHFWHDRRERPTTFGRERPADPEAVRRLVAQVVEATGVPLGV